MSALDATVDGVEQAHEPESHVDRLDRLLWQHLKHVEAFTLWTHRNAPRLEMADLTPTSQVWDCQNVSEADPVQGIGIVNLNAVAVSFGWPGNRAEQGLGISVPALSYARIPIRTGTVDVACSSFGGASQAPVLVFLYDHPPELAFGAVTGSSGGGSGGQAVASAVTAASPRSVTVGTGSALALASNGSRKGSSWVNTGSTTISLGLGAAAVAGDDIELAPLGSWDGMVGPALWQGSVYAISSAAGGTLAVVEV